MDLPTGFQVTTTARYPSRTLSLLPSEELIQPMFLNDFAARLLPPLAS